MKLVQRKKKDKSAAEKKPRMRKFVKSCEEAMLHKVKHYQTDFYGYDVPRLNKLGKTDRAILILRETGTYLAIDKDFKSRDDWEFYRSVIDNWKDQEFLYINFDVDNGEPARITEKSAVELINDFYCQHLRRASLAYSKAEDEYYSPKGLASDMKCPRIEDFGMLRGEYFNLKEDKFEKILLNRDIKSKDLEDYVTV